MSATRPSIGSLRLSAQLVSRSDCTTAGELVAWLGAVQAQNYDAAKWALGLRLAGRNVCERRIDEALADGSVLRTHALRGTWHLVARDDIRWLLALIGPRVIAGCTRRYSELVLSRSSFRRSNQVIARALEKDGELTREELAERLEDAGISTEGQRLPHLLQRAELEGIVCSSGVLRGKAVAYALLDRRVPPTEMGLDADDAIAELARRYFQSRGPATLDDFVWWSGLSAAQARSGLEAVRSALNVESAGGQTHWWGKSARVLASTHATYLLPAFDEYLVAYRNRDAVLDRTHARRLNAGGGMLAPCIVQAGRVIGVWRRVVGRTSVVVEVDLFADSTLRQRRAVELAARRYGAFLGREARVEFVSPRARGSRDGVSSSRRGPSGHR